MQSDTNPTFIWVFFDTFFNILERGGQSLLVLCTDIHHCRFRKQGKKLVELQETTSDIC